MPFHGERDRFQAPQFGDGADIGLAYEQLQLSPVVGNVER